MKRFAFLTFTLAALMAPIHVQAQQYSGTGCVTFPQNPNPEAEVRFLMAHPNVRVCPSAHPDLAGQARTLQQGATQRAIDTQRLMGAMSGR